MRWTHFLKLLLWWIADAFRGQHQELEMSINPYRINEQDRRDRRRGLYDDVEYREKVMKRMREGLTRKQLPPLINRGEFLQHARGTNVAQFKKEGEK